MSNGKAPQTLQQAIQYFADPENCRQFMIALRWSDGKVTCPYCGSENVKYLPNARVYKCYEKHARQKFSLKVGTIFEDSPIGLEKWLPAMWLIVNCKNGISSYELARDLGVTQKTGWFMLHRLRLAMRAKSFDKKLCGIVETDETYIGGLLRNMHASKRKAKGYVQTDKSKRKMSAGPFAGKTIVQAVVERDGEVRAQVIADLNSFLRREFVKENVERGSELMSDMGSTRFTQFVHEFINHEIEYVRGNVHTNSVENFWSLLKRGLHGTYISVEPFHLSRYVDEQSFRYNNRKVTDGERFAKVLSQVVGRRLTYNELTKRLNAN